MPDFPPPGLVRAADVREQAVPRHELAEGQGGAGGGAGERQRGVEVGERAVDEAERAQRVACCEGRGRERGQGEAQAEWSREVEEGWGYFSMCQWRIAFWIWIGLGVEGGGFRGLPREVAVKAP